MKLSEKVKADAEVHSIAEYPRESCGVVVADGSKQKYIRCRNAADNRDDFRISGQDWAAAEDQGRILAIVHSHINITATPSEADRVSCEASGLPWYICAVWKHPEDDEPYIHEWHSLVPDGYKAPLVGRSFAHGVLDCYTLIQDFYDRELGITLPGFNRPDDWWAIPEYGEIYLDNFSLAGFSPVSDGPRYGDVLLMQYRSDRTNHGGVFIGDRQLMSEPLPYIVPDAMLHHAMPRLSERVSYHGYWSSITRMIIRHARMI